ncbi:putative nucleoporin [Cercophora samala]|uniref:Nucleoporin n=1 Tax=Cercophora samala TaxID=330535 RepID=A0AA40DD27_9PEZI|nr:putative nucleoporin [Cercophora samala]
MFSTANKPPGQNIFGSNLFSQPAANQQQQAQQQAQPQAQQQAPLALGQTLTNPAQQLGSSIWQPGSQTNFQKPIPDQIKLITEKWDPSNPNCVFRTYLYNKVEEHAVPHYHPGPQDDPKEWDEALRNKPAANFMPVLCAGFPAIVARLTLQRRALAEFNNKLHAINASLDAILSRHDLEHSVRALNARRKHAEQSRRCLVLAAKVQILRNRGYALSGDEDQLKQKLQKIDKDLQDPALSARLEELWSRLIILRQYADSLKDEINKPGTLENGGLSEDVEAKAKKILEDYDKQLQHLRKQVEEAKKDFDEWEKEHQPTPAPSRKAR